VEAPFVSELDSTTDIKPAISTMHLVQSYGNQDEEIEFMILWFTNKKKDKTCGITKR